MRSLYDLPPDTDYSGKPADLREQLGRVQGLLVHIVKRYQGSIGGTVGWEDLMQEANIAAARSLESFDSTKGSLYNYLRRAVRNRMASRIMVHRAPVRVPLSAFHAKCNNGRPLQSFRQRLDDSVGYDSKGDAAEIDAMSLLSRHSSARYSDAVSEYTPPEQEDQLRQLERADLTAKLDLLKKKLPKRQRYALEQRLAGVEFQAIGKALGVTHQQASNLWGSAIENLRRNARRMKL